MTEYAKVKNEEGLVRHTRTRVILQTPDQLRAYRQKKAMLIRERDRDREIRTLRNDVTDLKSILTDLLQKMPNS